jgi:hypothetical protein
VSAKQGGKKSLYSLEVRNQAAEMCMANGGTMSAARAAAEKFGIDKPYLILGWVKGRQDAIREDQRMHVQARQEESPKNEADKAKEIQYLEMTSAKLALIYESIRKEPVPESVKKAVMGAFNTTFRVLSVRLADNRLNEIIRDNIKDLRPFYLNLTDQTPQEVTE